MSGSVYATSADRDLYGFPATALGELTVDQVNAALASFSGTVDSFFRGRYALPLVAWGVEVRKYTVWGADYELMNLRGYNPSAGADITIATRYQNAIDWLKQVQRRAAHPDVTEATTTSASQRPIVTSSSCVDVATGRRDANRGW